MKNLSLALNGVLLVAVAILYFLHFSNKSDSGQGGAGFTSGEKPLIAFIYADSVLKHYKYLDVRRKELEEKTRKMEQDYRARTEGLQNEFNNYQRNVGNMTLSQVRAVEEDLQRKQQNLRMYEQSLTQELMAEEAKLQKELYDRITSFLKKYGQSNGLHIVLKFDPTSDVLFAGDSLDITNDVIRGLNQEYDQKDGAQKAPADSTKR
jgi:outer membrane protein